MTGSEPSPGKAPAADRYIGIDHLGPSLTARSVRGGVVTILAQGVKVVAQAGAIVLLARLLAPEEFGRFAMVAAFLTVLELFKDLGLSTATVQRRDLSLGQVSTLFWLNAGLGVAVTLALAALAPVLAWLYGEPVLNRITPVVALAFLFTSLATQHLALLRRQMRFSAVAALQVGAEIAGLAAAVAAAFAQFGVWALVVQRLAWALATAAGAWAVCGWRPGRPGPVREVRDFLSFGGNATASMVVNYLATSLDKVLIGLVWGAAPLGVYERAQRILLLPVQNLNTPLATVALSALSRLADQPERYRQTYLAAVERLAMVITPIGGLFAGAAGPLVALVLGPRWDGAVPVLTWMGAMTLYMPVTYTLSWLYMSQDRTREMVRAALAGSTLTVAAIVSGLPFGPVGVAAAYAISGVLVRAPLLFWLAGRHGPVRARDLGGIVIAPATAGAAVAAVVWSLRAWLPADALGLPAEVAILTGAAIAVAVLVYAGFPGGRRAIRGLARLPAILFRSGGEATGKARVPVGTAGSEAP